MRISDWSSDVCSSDLMFGGLLAGVFGADLRRIGSRLAAALETHHAGARPGNRIALRVGDGDHRVVEGRVDVGHTRRDILAFAPAKALRFTSHDEILTCILNGRWRTDRRSPAGKETRKRAQIGRASRRERGGK